jgi:hypothetical protein
MDLSKYEGHTPGPWSSINRFQGTEVSGRAWISHSSYVEFDAIKEADSALISDAPLLLEEVKRLQVKNERLIASMIGVGAWAKNHKDDESTQTMQVALAEIAAECALAIKHAEVKP